MKPREYLSFARESLLLTGCDPIARVRRSEIKDAKNACARSYNCNAGNLEQASMMAESQPQMARGTVASLDETHRFSMLKAAGQEVQLVTQVHLAWGYITATNYGLPTLNSKGDLVCLSTSARFFVRT